MMWEYILPNFSGVGLVGFMALVAGIILFAASFFVSPFPRISGRVRGIGVLVGAIGAVAWLFASFVDDVLSNPKAKTVLIAAGIIVVFGFLLFLEPKKPRTVRRRRR